MPRIGALLLALALALAAGPASSASAAATEIGFGNNYFDPTNPPPRDFATGASFTWVRTDGDQPEYHVVHSRGEGLFRSDLLDHADTFTISASAGTFPYYCEKHPDQMTGVVAVRPIMEPIDTDSFNLVWADDGTTTGKKFDIRYRVNDRRWRDWSLRARAHSGVFGADDVPVNVKPGRTYDFRVRSRTATDEGRSKWSPVLTVTT